MPIEMSSDSSVCSRCGTEYSHKKGYFPVSYAQLYKGVGYLHVCRTCIESMYSSYLSQCNSPKNAVRQLCRKLDLYWSESVFESAFKKATTKTLMSQYIQKINALSYAGKSYDDTLLEEGTLWNFSSEPQITTYTDNDSDKEDEEQPVISEEVKAFWGSGYTPNMYTELEQRREYWMSRFPSDYEVDIGTEAIIRQICSLELDINRDRAAGRSVDKSITALNTLLGSMNLKPVQKKQEDADLGLTGTPLGVWLHRYENERPLPEIDDDLKDVNGIKKYVFTWMGHLCKMLGLKNAYSDLYEEEIEKLRVARPEYDGDDDELMMSELSQESPEEDDE